MYMKEKGFTLVELLSVIVIMGIILLVAIPSVFGISKVVKDNMFCTKVHNIENAAKLYGSDYQDDFDDKGYVKVDIKTIIDNNLYRKEIDGCSLGDENNGCVVDPRDYSVMDNKTVTIVKTGQRYYAYYDFDKEEDIVLCEGKKETDKYKHYDVTLDNQGATYPYFGTTIVRDVEFGHEMPNIEVPRKIYTVTLIDKLTNYYREEKVEYIFRGYFATKNGGVKYYDENGLNVHYYDLPDGRPLYAIWTDRSIPIEERKFSGYVFQGWYNAENNGDLIIKSGNYTPTFDIKLYAGWIPLKVELTLNSQSATFKGTEKVMAEYNKELEPITKPQKEYNVTLNYNDSNTPNTTLISKYDFDGYAATRSSSSTRYYDSNGKGIGPSQFTSRATLYAIWKNGSITLPNPTRAGYKFNGWYTAATGGTKVGNAGANYNPSKNITLYAQWTTDAYTVTLDNQNATSSGTTSVSATYGNALPRIIIPSKKYIVTLNYNGNGQSNSALTSNCTFNGYYTGINGTGTKYINADGTSARNYDLTSDIVLYAYWTNGSVTLPNATRSGYRFSGWYNSSNGGAKYGNGGDLYTPTKNITLYAQWTEETDAILKNGSKFLSAIMNFVKISETPGRISYSFSRIKNIVRSDYLPNDVDYVNLEDQSSGVPIYGWFDDGTLYIYCESRKIYANPDSMFLFSGLGIETLDMSIFDTSKVTNMSYMFHDCSDLTSLDVSTMNTSNVTNMHHMFYGTTSLKNLDLSSFNTSKVTDMSYMFYGSKLNSLNLKSFDTSSVTDMGSMFYGTTLLKNLDLSSFNTSRVTNMKNMFYNTGFTSIDLKNFDTSNVTNMSGMFSCSSVLSLDLSGFNTSNVRDMSEMFDGTDLVTLDLSTFDTSNVTNMRAMFYWSTELKNLNISNFNTSKVTNMSLMFAHCYDLINLDVTSFDTSNVTDMSAMFFELSSLKSLNVSNFNTSNVQSMSAMFAGISQLKSIDVRNFDTSNVTTMEAMFAYTSKLTSLDVTSFNTSKVTNMRGMFLALYELKVLDLSSFDTRNVTEISGKLKMTPNMYNGATDEDVAQGKDIGLFGFDQKLTKIYVGDNWDLSKVTYSDGTFYLCVKLVGGAGTKYVNKRSGWTASYAHIDGGKSNPGYLTRK